MKLKKGDKVIVIAGKEKNQRGIVREIDRQKNQVIVEGINKRTYHIKPTQQNPKGGLLRKEAPINISNVMLDVGGKNTPKPTKIGYKYVPNKSGKVEKKRYSKATGDII